MMKAVQTGRLLVYKTHTLAEAKLSRRHRDELGGNDVRFPPVKHATLQLAQVRI